MKIFIDQGHNPQNPNAGAEGFGLKEQDLNYEIGIRLGTLLAGNDFFEVKLSRPTPTTQLGNSNASSLAARVNAANLWGADYFISLHCNASVDASVSGSEAYVYSLQSRAVPLGEEMLNGISEAVGLADRGVRTNPSLYVLRRTTMPAVLMEMGYITNSRDAHLLATEPDAFARGMYNGILRFFGLG
ncbi:MAG: N-acetylmuramoyl-L-alanine amidase [Clostridia bacterium]|nr:N-acetylmuramoyl-L-alanine amidase [Clostridia bacterium]